jgi:hypothetical protein
MQTNVQKLLEHIHHYTEISLVAVEFFSKIND